MAFLTEADTCRRYVLPKLYAAGWTDEQISEQKSFTDGRIVVAGTILLPCIATKLKDALGL
jgi:type I site-specific restriction endonuclease